jgi:hypothetical protein
MSLISLETLRNALKAVADLTIGSFKKVNYRALTEELTTLQSDDLSSSESQ